VTKAKSALVEPKHSNASAGNAARPLVDLLRAAASEPQRPLDASMRRSLEQRLDYDFGRIRVHSGSASEAAAERVDARAYALGRDIHLGAEARALNGRDRERLLAHEAVHTAQQRGADIAPHDRLAVDRPGDAAEFEALRLAQSIAPSPSKRQVHAPIRPASPARGVLHTVSPHIQRDLTGKKKAFDGDFDLNLKTESHRRKKSGMSGTIKFKADEKAPDSKNIRLLQIARVEELTTGKEHEWTGGEANRMKVMSDPDKDLGVEPGYFVDVLHKDRTPRTSKTDAPVSPYYTEDYPTSLNPDDKNGSKQGKIVTEASLRDFPGSILKLRFSFETAAKADDKSYVYATLVWGFTLSDPDKGTIEKEHAAVKNIPSETLDATLTKFNEFYQNRGSSKAPK
jgi:hypothetical protein